MLLASGADRWARDKTGGTPLHSAVSHGHASVADALMQQESCTLEELIGGGGADGDALERRVGLLLARNKAGRSAGQLAVGKDDRTMLSVLLGEFSLLEQQHGQHRSRAGHHGRLAAAADNDDSDAAAAAAAGSGDHKNLPGLLFKLQTELIELLWTALAGPEGHGPVATQCFQALVGVAAAAGGDWAVAHRPSVRPATWREGWTLLHGAALAGQPGPLGALVAAGQVVSGSSGGGGVLASWLLAADDEGSRPLHVAAAAGHDAAVGLLLDLGAEPAALDRAGHSAAHRAAGAGFPVLADTLARAQAITCWPTAKGAAGGIKTLMLAAAAGSVAAAGCGAVLLGCRCVWKRGVRTI